MSAISRCSARIARLENRVWGGPAVAKIVRLIERASDEELDELDYSGAITTMAQRLGDRQLHRLIEELEAMQLRLLATGEQDDMALGVC